MVWIPGITTSTVIPPRVQRLLDFGGAALVVALGIIGRFVGLGPTWPDQSMVRLQQYERHRGKRLLHVFLIAKARIIVLGLLYVALGADRVRWWAYFALRWTVYGLRGGVITAALTYGCWRRRCYVIGSWVGPYIVGLELGMRAIDISIEWDPLFKQSCISLWRNECESRRAALREIRRRLKRCNNLPVSRVYISIEALVVFTPHVTRKRDERFLLAKQVRATLVNEWYPEKARKKSPLQAFKEIMHDVAYSRHEAKKRPALRRIGSTRLTLASRTEAKEAEQLVRASSFGGGQEPPPAAKGDRLLTIKVTVDDAVINLVGYDCHFAHTNLVKLIEALVEEDYEEEDDEEELIVFQKALVTNIKVNLYAAKSHEHYNAIDEEYDFVVKALSNHVNEQPHNLELGSNYKFEYEYRPVAALTLNNTTIAPRVFQRKRRLALFLERVVVKALASTALDGLDLAVGGSTTAVERVLKTTLGGVDRQASRLSGPLRDVIQGSTGAALSTGVGALQASRRVVDGVTTGAKTATAGVMNGVTGGKAGDVAKGLGDGAGEIIGGVDEGTRMAIGGVAAGAGAAVHGVGKALRYVPGVGKAVGGLVDATGSLVTGTLGVAGGVVGGVLGGVCAAGRGLARGDPRLAARGAGREVRGGLGVASSAAAKAAGDASASVGRGLRDTAADAVYVAGFVAGAARTAEGQKCSLGIADRSEARDEPARAATPEPGPGIATSGAGPSSRKKSGARSIRKAAAKATGLHGAFSRKKTPNPVPRRLFPEEDDGPPLRVPAEVPATVEIYDDL